MSQKATASLLIKIFLILVFLPIVLVWFVWKKTDWNKRSKWIATAGIVVVFLIVAVSSGKDTETKENAETFIEPQLASIQQKVEVKNEETELEQLDAKPTEEIELEILEEIHKVVSVVDGDTIKLDNGQVVRYIGIDTPETVHPSKPVQCFDKEASSKNKELVLNKEV